MDEKSNGSSTTAEPEAAATVTTVDATRPTDAVTTEPFDMSRGNDRCGWNAGASADTHK